MEMVFSLMGITFILVIIIACIFLAAIRGGQFEDMEGPAWRVVLDEDSPTSTQSSTPDPEQDHLAAREQPGPSSAADRPHRSQLQGETDP